MTQALCASVFMLIGIGAFAYGLRVLTGQSGLPWTRFVRRSPIPPPPPAPRDIMLAVILAFLLGLVSLLGGLGLLMIYLLQA